MAISSTYAGTSSLGWIIVTITIAIGTSIGWGDELWHAPVLPAPIEIAWQGALHPLAPAPAIDKRLALLDGIMVRTALEDTARLRGELG